MRDLKKAILQAIRATGVATVVVIGALPVAAQNVFSTAATVNNAVITEYEVAQRMRFLTLLNAPGSGRDTVIGELVDQSLRDQAAAAAGMEPTEEDIQAGMEEFSARIDLGAEEFIAVIGENGVAAETFRNFVASGVAWRDYVRARFGSRSEITEEEINQALGTGGSAGNVRVLLSEIVIPATPQNRVEVEDLATQISAAQSAGQFADYARKYSAATTARNGGRLPWRSLEDLPPGLRPLLLSLAPGEISDPLPLPNAVAIFQLRDIEETSAPEETLAAIEYAAYYIPGGRSDAALREATGLRGRVDQCDDLYGEALGKPQEILERVSRAPGEIPQDIARELDRLDPGEVSTALTRGENLVFLMLCGRTAAVNEGVDRAQAAALLRQARINAYADSLLSQLRAEARIEIK